MELFKFNQWGDEIWRRLLDLGYPGPTSVDVECHGNDIYVASTQFDFDEYSVYFAKFDSSGVVAWDTALAFEPAYLNTAGFVLSEDGQTAYLVADGEPKGELHVVRGYAMCLDSMARDGLRVHSHIQLKLLLSTPIRRIPLYR
ncbi:MAG: hypothetical protein IPP40_16790 [bacterium]|nr:hypothetical protein [bacterium]